MLDLAKAIMKTLKETYSLESVIAGGYPRDVYYNVVPKDIDIIVACKLDHRDIFNVAKDVCYTYRKEGLNVEIYEAYGTSNNQLISCIMKIGDADVIFYEVEEPLMAVTQFDSNLNRFIMCKDSPLYIGNIEDLNNPPVFYFDFTPDERKNYLREKWERYTGRSL